MQEDNKDECVVQQDESLRPGVPTGLPPTLLGNLCLNKSVAVTGGSTNPSMYCTGRMHSSRVLCTAAGYYNISNIQLTDAGILDHSSHAVGSTYKYACTADIRTVGERNYQHALLKGLADMSAAGPSVTDAAEGACHDGWSEM